MRISSVTTVAFTTMLAALCRAVIASVALAMMTSSASGSAKTVGIPHGEIKVSSTLPTGRSVSTLRCGRLKSKDAANLVPPSSFRAKDNGKTVEIPVGARFCIELEENPTTGYKWSVPAFDEKCLVLKSDQYPPSKGTGIGRVGILKFGF